MKDKDLSEDFDKQIEIQIQRREEVNIALYRLLEEIEKKQKK